MDLALSEVKKAAKNKPFINQNFNNLIFEMLEAFKIMLGMELKARQIISSTKRSLQISYYKN